MRTSKSKAPLPNRSRCSPHGGLALALLAALTACAAPQAEAPRAAAAEPPPASVAALALSAGLDAVMDELAGAVAPGALVTHVVDAGDETSSVVRCLSAWPVTWLRDGRLAMRGFASGALVYWTAELEALDADSARVIISRRQRGQCGYGKEASLRLIDGRWTVIEIRSLWIS